MRSNGEEWATPKLIVGLAPIGTLGAAVVATGLDAITAVAGKGLADQRGEVTTLIQTVAGSLIFLPFVDFAIAIPMQSWGWLGMIGVVQTGIAWLLVYSAYPHVATPLLAALSVVNPLTAILSDWVIFGRLIALTQALGMVLIVIGTFGVRLRWRVTPPSGSIV